MAFVYVPYSETVSFPHAVHISTLIELTIMNNKKTTLTQHTHTRSTSVCCLIHFGCHWLHVNVKGQTIEIDTRNIKRKIRQTTGGMRRKAPKNQKYTPKKRNSRPKNKTYCDFAKCCTRKKRRRFVMISCLFSLVGSLLTVVIRIVCGDGFSLLHFIELTG